MGHDDTVKYFAQNISTEILKLMKIDNRLEDLARIKESLENRTQQVPNTKTFARRKKRAALASLYSQKQCVQLLHEKAGTHFF